MALKGIKVLEFCGLAPAPFCGMVLADFGANVIRIDKLKGQHVDDFLARGKRSIAIDLKKPKGVKLVKELCKDADVLVEPYRPGVMEKLGLGPDVLIDDNPRLIYTRLTGYGQSGPYKNFAGHDLNYLAISGVLSKLGKEGENPAPPVNLLADFAGGGLLCAFGVLAALIHRSKTGKGQIIDCSMVEGVAYVSSILFATKGDQRLWPNPDKRGENLLDGGWPFYNTYCTKDHKFLTVACLEPQFANQFLQVMELHMSTSNLDLKTLIAEKFMTKTRDEWTRLFHEKAPDACIAPVLDFNEAVTDAHNKIRDSFDCHGSPQPAPRLSSCPAASANQNTYLEPGSHSTEILLGLGYSNHEIDRLIHDNIVRTDHQQRYKSKF